MIRCPACLCYGIALWLLTAGAGAAQKPVSLQLNQERLLYASEVQQQALQRNDSLGLAEAWYLYGKTYALAGEYQIAQQYFLNALLVQEAHGDSYELSRLYVRLSETENRRGRLTAALAYANQALLVARRVRSDKALNRAYGALGTLYEQKCMGQIPCKPAYYDTVLAYYHKEWRLSHKLRDERGIAEASMHLGVFLMKNRKPEAIPYLQEALRLFTVYEESGIRVKTMLHLASAYLTIGKPGQAFQQLQQAEQFYSSHKLNEFDTKLELERTFVAYFSATRQWQQAFGHVQKQDQLVQSQILADCNDPEKKETWQTAQQRELALQTANLQTQQQLTILTGGLLAMALGVSVVFFRLYRKNQRISRQNEVLVREQNHRVKNNLQVVSSLLSLQVERLTDVAAKQAVAESQLRVQTMAILHRRLYDRDRLAQVRLDTFIPELTGTVLKTFGYAAVPVQYAIDPIYLIADKATSLGLILNELMTNACKYALPHNPNPILRIRCHQRGRTLIMTVADNGPGLPNPSVLSIPLNQSPVTSAGSFGIVLIQTQVQQLNGTGRFDPAPENARGGTVFTLTFNT